MCEWNHEQQSALLTTAIILVAFVLAALRGGLRPSDRSLAACGECLVVWLVAGMTRCPECRKPLCKTCRIGELHPACKRLRDDADRFFGASP
jgi:hypothetical protein